MYLKDNSFLEEQDIIHLAPSVYSETDDATAVSETYSFIPTYRIMGVLESEGWHPTFASQTRTRNPDGLEFVKHCLRFRRTDVIDPKLLQVGDCVPELILTNSHDGTTAFLLSLGLFRKVCSNGLFVCDSNLSGIRMKHHNVDRDVIEASYRIIQDVPQITEKVAKFREITLSEGERKVMAKSAAELKWHQDLELPIEPDRLLAPRRYADHNPDLWTTFNVIQENLIRGGVPLKKAGRFPNTRRTSSVNEDIRINKGLWQMVDRVYETKRRYG